MVEPPVQASGAPVLLFVNIPLHPPVPDAVANHALKAALTCACVKQAEVVVFTGQVNTTVDGAGTVNVAWQVVVYGAQMLVYVNSTVVDPPQAGGAPVLLFVNIPLHPPVPDAVANHALKAAFTCPCVKQAAVVVLTGHVNTTVAGAGTVNVAWHVVVNGAQLLV